MESFKSEKSSGGKRDLTGSSCWHLQLSFTHGQKRTAIMDCCFHCSRNLLPEKLFTVAAALLQGDCPKIL